MGQPKAFFGIKARPPACNSTGLYLIEVCGLCLLVSPCFPPYLTISRLTGELTEMYELSDTPFRSGLVARESVNDGGLTR